MVKRIPVVAGVLLLAVFGLYAGSAAAAPSSVNAERADRLAVTPCPGPYPTPVPTPYGGYVQGSSYKFGATGGSHSNKQCLPPPSGPPSSPTLCQLHLHGYGAPYSVITCSPLPPPLCGTRAASALRITGTGLHLTAPGEWIYLVEPTGFFTRIGAVTGSGGVYEFVPIGSGPQFVTGTGTCVKVPLPRTGSASWRPAPRSSTGMAWLWYGAAVLVIGAAGLLAWPVLRSRRAAPADPNPVEIS